MTTVVDTCGTVVVVVVAVVVVVVSTGTPWARTVVEHTAVVAMATTIPIGQITLVQRLCCRVSTKQH